MESLARLFLDLEVRLVLVSRIERSASIDTQMLNHQSHELAKEMHELEQQAYAVAGHSFNLGSPKQIG